MSTALKTLTRKSELLAEHGNQLHEDSNIESIGIRSRVKGRKRYAPDEDHSSLELFVQQLRKKTRHTPRLKRRSLPLASKYVNVSPRARSPRQFHLQKGREVDCKKNCFSPILLGSTLKVTQSRQTVKRRTGLVRRSHSPVTVLSPISRPFNLNILSSNSESSKGKHFLTLPINDDEVNTKFGQKAKLPMKISSRRRFKSPFLSKNICRRTRSHSPCSHKNALSRDRKSFGGQPILPSYNTSKPQQADLRIMGPTVRGIVEAARVTRYPMSCMLSIPTETSYALTYFVPLQKSLKILNESMILHHSKEDNLLKTITNGNSVPTLLLHSPTQALQFMSVSKPKTFACKNQDAAKKSNCSPIPGKVSEEDQCCSLTAVKFSESYEVFNRLTSAFWPGPIKIFAPVRMRTSKSDSKSTSTKRVPPNANDNFEISSGNNNSKLQDKSMGACVMSNNMADRGRLHATDAVPIFPTSVLTTCDALFGKKSVKGETPFVGFRCPSHPLANRVLVEAYTNGTSKAVTDKEIRGQENTIRLKGAFFGSSIYDNKMGYAETTMEVCTNIASRTQGDVDTKTVYVLNGEDKREIFHVSPCQFRKVESISLVVNPLNRTVSIIRTKKNCADSSSSITIAAVEQAIHMCKPCEGMALKSMIVSSVMRRWKVLECISHQ